jgi:ubiquinone/menaquinone biosynthesis C-methylase UbiE
MEEFLNPEKILEKLNLDKKMIAADFGCGSGGWTIPLAKKVKWVYAIDLLEEPLSALRGKMKMEKIFNIDTLRGNIEKKTSLISEICDLVLISNVLFQVDDIKGVLEEAKRVIKKGGKILIVDWIRDNPLTPEIEWVDFDKVKEIAKELGLVLKEEFSAGKFHQALIFEKE